MRKMTKRESPEWFNCICPICGEKFHLKKCALDKIKTHPCCSKDCMYKYKKILMTGEGNHQYGLKGNKNSSWKSDRRLSRYKYWQIRVPDHPFRDKADFVFEHRLVAEKYLLTDENSVEINGKKYLSPEFIVHHKNFDRMDNRVENLEVMKKEEHQRLHSALNVPERNPKNGRFLKNEDTLSIRRVTETAILPKRQTEGSAGYDLCADIDEQIVVQPHESVMLSSGLAFSIPKGYFGAIYARSGISTKRSLRPSTCVSIIDSDYRGVVMLPVHNDSDIPQVIEPHERIAQLIIQKPYIPDIEIVDSLDDTERGDGGFGSTGK